MINVPGLLFLAFPARYFLLEEDNPVWLVLMSVLLICTSFLLLRTATSDPGHMPRYTVPESTANDPGFSQPVVQTFLISLRGRLMNMKYCETCALYLGHIYRPPRCVHCSDCDLCILRFDHHCPWLGNCIGLANYRLFFIFLSSLVWLNIIGVAGSVTHWAVLSWKYQLENDSTSWEAFLEGMKAGIPSVVLSVAGFLVPSKQVIWLVIGLWCYHLRLMQKSQTTYEHLKGHWILRAGNPYENGKKCANLKERLCYVGKWLPGVHFRVKTKVGIIKELDIEHRMNVECVKYKRINGTSPSVVPGEMDRTSEVIGSSEHPSVLSSPQEPKLMFRTFLRAK